MVIKQDKYQIEAKKHFASLLKGIELFIEKHPIVNYIEFDYYVVHNMTLFSIEPNFDFSLLETTIRYINKSLPAIKRIFTKPIIVLKENDDVLPVENARIINQGTFQYLANHSQHVENITARGVKPRKLLTRVYEDDYTIYENVIFCNLVDDILYFASKNRHILSNLLYASDIMRFNILEKVNHLNYFLAIGKLHTGYIRDFSHYLALSNKLLVELNQITKSIQPRLNKPIYQKNKRRNTDIRLKKTNIFLMQKDYKQVFKTHKYLSGKGVIIPNESVDFDEEWINKYYSKFVQLLIIFALGHYNFEVDPKIKMDLNNLNVEFSYKDWRVTVQNNEDDSMLLYFKKNTYYRVMIVGYNYDDEKLKTQIIKRRLHDVIKVDPFEYDYVNNDNMSISMDDIDSFRRLQQVILKGMIYTDTVREVCPFCGGTLEKQKNGNGHTCSNCQLSIHKNTCPETKLYYFYTTIPEGRHKSNLHKNISEDKWQESKRIESEMFYKNITKLSQDGSIICPYCKKIHVSIG